MPDHLVGLIEDGRYNEQQKIPEIFDRLIATNDNNHLQPTIKIIKKGLTFSSETFS